METITPVSCSADHVYVTKQTHRQATGLVRAALTTFLVEMCCGIPAVVAGSHVRT